ncbi:MAG: MATE family efflux transporter [Polyangiaceae bacterium]|nr:MATE family efflux transporter [Polyangiaceae bacterium]
MTMALVDAAIVGRQSSTGLAAVSLGGSLVFAAVCPAMGISMAVEPIASQARGAGEPERADDALRAGVLASLLLSAPTMLLALLSTLLLELVGVPDEVARETRWFVVWRLPGVVGWLLFMVAKAALEAEGRVGPLLVSSWATNVVNLLVCALLVLGDGALAWIGLPPAGLPALGVAGAGLATTLSSGLLAWLALRAALRGGAWGGRTRLRELWPEVSTQLRVGLPIGLQLLTEVGAFSVAGLLAGRLGPTVTAAHQVAMGIASFTFMGVLGIGGATAVRVGRRVGEGTHAGARRAGLAGIALGAAYMATCAGLVVVFAPRVAGLFSVDPEVISTAAPLLTVAAAFQVFDGVQGVAGGALRGAGDTRFASWANAASHWSVGLPLALVLAFGLGHGVLGLWWGLGVGLVIVAGTLLARFLWLTARPIARLQPDVTNITAPETP